MELGTLIILQLLPAGGLHFYHMTQVAYYLPHFPFCSLAASAFTDRRVRNDGNQETAFLFFPMIPRWHRSLQKVIALAANKEEPSMHDNG